jgi:hypothetical protein
VVQKGAKRSVKAAKTAAAATARLTLAVAAAAVTRDQTPRRPVNSFILFCAAQKAQSPATTAQLGERWRALTDAEKAQWKSA